MSASGKRQFKTLRQTPRAKATPLTADLQRRGVLPTRTARVLPRGGKTARGR